VKQYILRRLALAVPTLFLVSVIVFALMRLMPGDVATRMVEGPNTLPTIIVVATTGLSTIILTKASLSFLGLGVPPPFPTWGGMLSLAGLDHMYQAPWLAIWPAVALSLAVFGFNMLGDGLRDLLDPKLKGR
jgi:ABC-type dipeptide/oligopeptide/nickel transport system permease subunit